MLLLGGTALGDGDSSGNKADMVPALIELSVYGGGGHSAKNAKKQHYKLR